MNLGLQLTYTHHSYHTWWRHLDYVIVIEVTCVHVILLLNSGPAAFTKLIMEYTEIVYTIIVLLIT